MKTNPMFFGMPAGIKSPDRLDVKTLASASGRNTGNFLFCNTLRDILSNNEYPYAPRNYFLKNMESYDYVVFSAANWLNPSHDMSTAVELLEKTKLPCLVVGLGAQSGLDGALPKLKPSTIKFLEIVSQRSNYISVRGEFTNYILQCYGFNNGWVTGCPSLLNKYLPDTISHATSTIDVRDVVLQSTRHGHQISILNDASNANKINLNIYRYAITKKHPLLLQSEWADIAWLTNKISNQRENEEISSILEKVYMKETEEIRDYIRSKALIYWNVPDWIDGISKFKYLVGTRIHGCVAALSAGVPAVLVIHDQRTQELADVMNIPSIHVNDIIEFDESLLDNIIKNTSFEKFELGVSPYKLNFRKFFVANDCHANIRA